MVVEFEGVTVEAAGGLHQVLAALKGAGIRRNGDVFRFVRRRLKKRGQLSGLLRRQLEVRHFRPGEMLGRISQKRRQSARGELLAHVSE